MISKSQENSLIKEALKVLKNSHSPHSGFKVGAAILSSTGKIYPGTNVEFDALTLTVCAERSALFGAVSGGDKKFTAIAVATSSNEFIYPCGLCRQALVEFNPKMEVILITKKKKIKSFILKDIIPNYFKLNRV
ncbi:MAG: cytidine deaminase [Ignavibacteria bacterium]|nr:cytidine deaminase [Ignavibacteria bacterium]